MAVLGFNLGSDFRHLLGLGSEGQRQREASAAQAKPDTCCDGRDVRRPGRPGLGV